MEKPYLVHWSDDSDHNTEAVATLNEARTEIDRWLDLRRREADDGWALDMTGCIAVIVERVVEEESGAPEWSSFDRHVDYHREKVPDPRDARIAALEGELSALRAKFEGAGMIFTEHAEAVEVLAASHVGDLDFVESIEALVKEVSALKASAEANADAVSEHEAISALMAADPVLCRYGVLEAFQMLKARADEACGEPAPLRLPSVDEVSARVHEAWMESKRRAGVTSRKLEGGEELMVPYADLSEQAKELDRATVRAVYAAIGAAGRPEPAPLRLGRGPTVEEAKAHADAQEDGHGWWLVSFDVKRRPDDEAIYFEIASIEVEDGEVFVDGMSSADGSRYTEITDAIPLDASRQPCGVGVRS